MGARFRSIRFPLEFASDIVAIDDRIYVTSDFFARVQVYDLNGAFLFGFQVPESTGGTLLLDAREDEVLVIAVRSTTKSTFTPDGTFLKSEPASPEEEAEMGESQGYYRDRRTGREFRLYGGILPAKVYWREPTGEWKQVFEENWLYWLAGCLYTWVLLTAILGVALLSMRR